MFEWKKILVLSCCLHAGAASAAWLEGETQAPECLDALRHAEAVYRSRASRLHSPDSISRDLHSDAVLAAVSVSGALNRTELPRATPEYFDTLTSGYKRPLFWSRRLSGPVRIALLVEDHGSRGEGYSLFLLDGRATQQSLYVPFNRGFEIKTAESLTTFTWRPPHTYRQKIREPYLLTPVETLIDTTRTPPTIFRHRTTDRLWVVDYGDKNIPFGAWTIYVESTQGLRTACRIRFHRRAATASSPSPPAPRLTPYVRRLFNLMNLTLGSSSPGYNRYIESGHTWTNVVHRPWVVRDDDRYNSRQEVDEGLKRWARIDPSFKKIRQEIRATYPLAKRELSAHYRRRFRLSAKNADEMAHWALDIAYNANYAFTNGGQYFRYLDKDTNPWRPHWHP